MVGMITHMNAKNRKHADSHSEGFATLRTICVCVPVHLCAGPWMGAYTGTPMHVEARTSGTVPLPGQSTMFIVAGSLTGTWGL